MRFGARPYDWATEFDTRFASLLEDRNMAALADPQTFGTLLRQAHPSVDHYLPALTIAGAADSADQLVFMNDTIDIASVSMRSFVFY